MKNYYVDYHMHSNISSDAKDSVDAMCRSAITKGISEIAITDHFEPMPGDENNSIYLQDEYETQILNARKKFDRYLDIKLGVEIGQPHYFPNETKEMLKKVNYDFVIASAHKLVNGMDMSQIDYTLHTKSAILDKYLKELDKLVSGFDDFDVIGHLDLVKRYSFSVYNEKISLAYHREKLEALLKKIIHKGKGIEINTSGLRQKYNDTLPGLDIIKIYKDLGGEIITVGSDAHNSFDLGSGIKEAYQIAEACGFRYVTTFTNRIPDFVKISDGIKIGA